MPSYSALAVRAALAALPVAVAAVPAPPSAETCALAEALPDDLGDGATRLRELMAARCATVPPARARRPAVGAADAGRRVAVDAGVLSSPRGGAAAARRRLPAEASGPDVPTTGNFDCPEGTVKYWQGAVVPAHATDCEGDCCTGTDACAGVSGCVAKDGTCAGAEACKDATAYLFAEASCVGTSACQGATTSRIKGTSCVGDHACRDARPAKITKGSCVGENACLSVAASDGHAGSIVESCQGYAACQYLAHAGGSAGKVKRSCLADRACYGVGASGGSFGDIVRSCHRDEACASLGRNDGIAAAATKWKPAGLLAIDGLDEATTVAACWDECADRADCAGIVWVQRATCAVCAATRCRLYETHTEEGDKCGMDNLCLAKVVHNP